ncbi:MAG TPA: ribosome small subunit-dependent GTPase A [Chitinophagaceae bacterium]|jgi:ribosome biogenesis GTPase|nr:ribosome small subunit-dependent GTPase A [Chitinophagaceae bacterium]
MEGIVYKSTGSWYVVRDDAGRVWNARMKGVFKLDAITSTNPIAVGDRVDLEPENEGESSATITRIHDRHNHINRQSPRAKHHQHIVAANLDQSLLVATVREPRTSLGFIDRFLVACEMYHVPAVILFNKSDVYREPDRELFGAIRELYEEVGYKVLLVSVRKGEGLEEAQSLLRDKTTLISGHSGVGKSSFINAIVPEAKVKTKDVSGWSGKGMHTTTFAEMYDLPFGGRIIDTPGMREFGLVGVDRQELSGYFPEMRARLNDCQFNNCLHINEPGCAVKDAVAEGLISEDRYVSYYNILDSLKEEKW